MDKDEEIKEKFEAFQKKLKESALGINYIEPKFKERFIEIAKTEYGNDYGHALTGLIKYYDGLCNMGHEEINAKIEILANELSDLKKRLDELKDNKKPEWKKSPDGNKLELMR